MITIYTDGSCSNNPGVAGWAYVILPHANSKHLVYAGSGSINSTSNRMELTAVIEALTYIESQQWSDQVTVISDSQYICRAINESWLDNWIDNNFKNIKNQDLWLRLYRLLCKLNVSVVWTKAHVNNPYNELADRLANEARIFQGQPNQCSISKLRGIDITINETNS